MTPGTAEHVYALEQRIQALERTVADTAELLQIAVGEIETRDAKVAELVEALEGLLSVAIHAGGQAPPEFVRARSLVEGEE